MWAADWVNNFTVALDQDQLHVHYHHSNHHRQIQKYFSWTCSRLDMYAHMNFIVVLKRQCILAFCLLFTDFSHWILQDYQSFSLIFTFRLSQHPSIFAGVSSCDQVSKRYIRLLWTSVVCCCLVFAFAIISIVTICLFRRKVNIQESLFFVLFSL